MPVILTIAQATRLSSFCLTMATASINEPMMKSTESVIRLCATLDGLIPSSTIWPMMMRSGTVGSGIGSVTNSTVATSDIASTIWPSRVSPSACGKFITTKPINNATKNQRFSQKKYTSTWLRMTSQRW